MKSRKHRGRRKKEKMAVLTAKCDRMFSVDKKSLNDFYKVEANKKIREQAELAASKISQKITIEEKPFSNDNA